MEAAITKVEDKRRHVIRYVDPDVEGQWVEMKTYQEGTWEEFKIELLTSYGLASSLEKGSLLDLAKIQANHKSVIPEDLAGFLSLKREMVAVVRKLMKEPAIISNREAVSYFLSCLNQSYARDVIHRLEYKKLNDVIAAADVPRLEDQFKFDEVVDAAERISRGMSASLIFTADSESRGYSTGPFRSSGSAPAMKSEEIEQMQQKLASLEDGQKIQQKQTNSRLDEIMKTLAQGLGNNQGQGQSSGQQYNREAPRRPAPNYNANAPENACFYYWESGHRMLECHKRNGHLDIGKLKAFDGRVKMANGDYIPNEPSNKSPYMRVEELSPIQKQMYMGDYHNTPGLISINLNDQAPTSLYTNAPYDNRDRMLSQYRAQLENLQAEHITPRPKAATNNANYSSQPVMN